MLGIMLLFRVGEPTKSPEQVKTSAATVLLGVALSLYTFTSTPAFWIPLAIARASFSLPPHMLS